MRQYWYRCDIKEWNKSLKSKSALLKYETSEEGKGVRNLEQKVFMVVDQLFKDDRIKTKEEKSVLEDAIRDVVDASMNPDKKNRFHSRKDIYGVKAFYNYFYEGISNGTIRHGNNVYTPGTILVWKSFGKLLNEYCKYDILFDDIDKPFVDKFTVFLEKKKLMPNTINKNVTCFRKLCNLAAMEGYNKNAISLKVWQQRLQQVLFLYIIVFLKMGFLTLSNFNIIVQINVKIFIMYMCTH